MGALGLQDVTETTSREAVSLTSLAELTGFPVDYIKRELSLESDETEELSVEELRVKVLTYLSSTF
jgi:predicted HTH domain antitoxin